MEYDKRYYMIWAFEWLTEKEANDLGLKLDPLMDFRYSLNKGEGEYSFRTYCAGFDEDNIEIRKVRHFRLEDIKEGLICDDIGEAERLSNVVFNDNLHGDITAKYKWLVDYLKVRPKQYWLAIPVKSYIEYFANRPRKLEVLHEELIWEIENHEALKTKDPFGSKVLVHSDNLGLIHLAPSSEQGRMYQMLADSIENPHFIFEEGKKRIFLRGYSSTLCCIAVLKTSYIDSSIWKLLSVEFTADMKKSQALFQNKPIYTDQRARKYLDGLI